MAVVFKKTNGLTDAITHYCPGCTCVSRPGR